MQSEGLVIQRTILIDPEQLHVAAIQMLTTLFLLKTS